MKAFAVNVLPGSLRFWLTTALVVLFILTGPVVRIPWFSTFHSGIDVRLVVRKGIFTLPHHHYRVVFSREEN